MSMSLPAMRSVKSSTAMTATVSITDAVSNDSARVVEHGGAITGHTTGLAIDCHAVGHSNTDLQALLA